MEKILADLKNIVEDFITSTQALAPFPTPLAGQNPTALVSSDEKIKKEIEKEQQPEKEKEL